MMFTPTDRVPRNGRYRDLRDGTVTTAARQIMFMIEDSLFVGGNTVTASMPRNGDQPTRMASNHNWCARGDNTKYMAKS